MLKRRSRLRRIFGFERRPSVSTSILFVFLILASGLLGFYWYGRNWVLFDNPFHPTDFRIGDRLIFGTEKAPTFEPAQRGSASIEALWQNFHSLVSRRIFDQHRPFSAGLRNMAGWGWFNFACGLSALAYALIYVRRLRLLIISFILSLLGLFAFVSIDPFYMRFTLWFPVVFGLSFVFLLSNITGRWLRRSLLVLAMLCTLLNWIAVLNVGRISVTDFRRMMQLPALERSTAKLFDQKQERYTNILEIVPKDEVIGFCFSRKMSWAYPLYDSDLSRHLEYVPVEHSNFIEHMSEKDIRYLFVGQISFEQRQLIDRAIQDRHLKQIRGSLYALKEN